MSNNHSNHHHHHKGLFGGMSEKQQGIVIGATAATAVTVPVTVWATDRAIKAKWLERVKAEHGRKK